MIEGLKRFFFGGNSDDTQLNRIGRKRRKVYRLRYAEPVLQKPIEGAEGKKESTTRPARGRKKRATKEKVTEKTRAESVEDVEKAVELIREAAMYLLCPFCKARLVDEIEYLLRYHYKTMLVESGKDPKEAEKLFKERYEGVVKRRVDTLRKELGISDYDYKEAVAEKAKALIGKP